MDHTEALPDDVLAAILRRLQPRDLASSRCVRSAWLAVVDAHRLLLPHALPHWMRGLFLTFIDYERRHLFARPSAQPTVDGNLSYLPYYCNLSGDNILDHCNGLLLQRGWNTLWVINPATRRWDDIPWERTDANPRLVFDPAISPHYEVFLVPRQREIESKGDYEDPCDLMEWPPSLWTLNVFSSRTRQWHMRSFVREGEAAGTIATVRLDPSKPICLAWSGPRWRYSVYWKGSLYAHCRGAFVVRLSLSDGKYQVIKAPMDIEKIKHAQFLGRSEKGVYLATLDRSHQLRVWTLTESSKQIHWLLKHHVDLMPWTLIGLRGLKDFEKTWTILDDGYVHCRYDDDDDDEEEEVEENEEEEEKEVATNEDREWNSDDDNVLNIDDYDTGSLNQINFLGFHPYKEVVFLGLPSLMGVAYHLKSSKVQYLGKMRPNDYDHSPTNGIYEAFPYTPCMIGELLNPASENPHRD